MEVKEIIEALQKISSTKERIEVFKTLSKDIYDELSVDDICEIARIFSNDKDRLHFLKEYAFFIAPLVGVKTSEACLKNMALSLFQSASGYKYGHTATCGCG